MKHTLEKIKLDKEAKAKEKKKNRSWKLFAGIILLAQVLASGYAFQRAFATGMFPGKLLFAFGGILVILLALNYLLLFSGAKETSARTFRRFIAILLVIAITVGGIYTGNVLGTVDSTVGKITTKSEEDIASAMDVYVLAKSSATSLADCKGLTFGVVGGSDGPSSFAAITKINNELGTDTSDQDYASTSELADALLNNSVDVAVINQNYVDILEETEVYAGFRDKVKLITTVNITAAELAQAKEDNPFHAGDGDMLIDLEPATEKVDNIEIEPFIVYISGSDTRDEYFSVSRSDVNILMVVNPQTKQILLVNTPRDFYIPNPRSSAGTKDKLTHLGIYGVDCSIAGLENLYDIDINYYVQINFTGTETLIDDLGGVTIDNPQSFSSTGYSFPAGEITLNGPQALVYARERYAFAEGDNMRGQNQMRLIRAVIDKLTTPDTSLILNYKTILSDLEGFIVTNLEEEEIDALVKMQLNDLASWDVKTYSVSGWGGYDYTYSMPGQALYVTYPYSSSVNHGTELINKVLAGEIITDGDVG